MSAARGSVGYRFGRFELQVDERRLLSNGEAVRVTPHVFDLLVALVERSGHLVTKDELLSRVWGKVVVGENTLAQHVSALRKVIGADAITTISGRGYRFTQEVVEQSATESRSSGKHNLPHALTSFIGRDKEIDELAQLLAGTRLLTLTGAGGCGKTRLAIEFARKQAEVYPDGVWLVELATLRDAALLSQTLASVVGVKEKAGVRLVDTIVEDLASRALLLLFDNAEHLVEACAQLVDVLLRRCARLVIVITSREPLRITGELTYRVPSLSVPDEQMNATPESIAAYESTRLLIERARLQLPRFAVTMENSRGIASICRRLDGIALAIELAAPRVRTLSVEELSRRLDQRFEILTEGSRTALPRHRTLRALVDWSYDLLGELEKATLRRLSVFSGGWTLEAAEQVCGFDAADRSKVLDLLASLADKNLILVRTHANAVRYGILETVRDYARDRLVETGEHSKLQERHFAYFLSLAEEARRQQVYGESSAASASVSVDQLEAERDNMRSALSWSTASHAEDGALRLAGALAWFWVARGYYAEGRRWLAAALSDETARRDPTALILALRAASGLAQRQADHAAARRLAEEALAISTHTGDQRSIAEAWLIVAAAAQSQGDYRKAKECYERALILLREVDLQGAISIVLCNLGQMATAEGDYDEANTQLSEAAAIARAVGHWQLPNALTALATCEHYRGNSEHARSLLDEALARRRSMGDREGTADSLVALAEVCHDFSDHVAALSLLREALTIQRELLDPRAVAHALFVLGEVVLALTGALAAARLWGQVERLHEELGTTLTRVQSIRRERGVAAARVELGEEEFQIAWTEGRAMTLDETLAFALAIDPPDPRTSPSG